MRRFGLTSCCGLLASVTVLSAGSAYGASESAYGSGVQAYFGSQSNGVLQSNPTAVFSGSTSGPAYTAGAGIPGLPPEPTPIVFTGGWTGNAFSGTPSVSTFNDGNPPASNTSALSKIVDAYASSPALTQDTSVQIAGWNFNQANGATGYAYEQLNFATDYLVSGAGLGGSTPNFPMVISGNTAVSTAGTGFAQYDEVVNYWWIPSTFGPGSSGAVMATPAGLPMFLGNLSYSYSTTGPGPFSASLLSAGSLAATPGGNGVLELTGHAWVAGDPFSFSVISDVPEPGSVSLLVVGGLGMLRRRR